RRADRDGFPCACHHRCLVYSPELRVARATMQRGIRLRCSEKSGGSSDHPPRSSDGPIRWVRLIYGLPLGSTPVLADIRAASNHRPHSRIARAWVDGLWDAGM